MQKDLKITARVCEKKPDYSLAWLLADGELTQLCAEGETLEL